MLDGGGTTAREWKDQICRTRVWRSGTWEGLEEGDVRLKTCLKLFPAEGQGKYVWLRFFRKGDEQTISGDPLEKLKPLSFTTVV